MERPCGAAVKAKFRRKECSAIAAASRPFGASTAGRAVEPVLPAPAVQGSPAVSVSKLMTWYATRKDDYVSPVVRGMRRSKGAKRSRILDDEEIRAAWKACDGIGTFGGLVRVLLLTAQPLRKVATMQWDDVRDGVWSIRSEPREKGHAGSLTLPTMVVPIIDAQPRLHENLFVFPAAHGHGPMNSFSQRKAELDAALKKLLPEAMPEWVLHDLGRTARSLMSRVGIRPDISERVLGHVIRCRGGL